MREKEIFEKFLTYIDPKIVTYLKYQFQENVISSKKDKIDDCNTLNGIVIYFIYGDIIVNEYFYISSKLDIIRYNNLSSSIDVFFKQNIYLVANHIETKIRTKVLENCFRNGDTKNIEHILRELKIKNILEE